MQARHLLFLILFSTATTVTAQSFVEAAADVGLMPTHDVAPICFPPIGSGSAWADFDADGDLDLYVTNHGGPNSLYRNDGDLDFDGLPNYTDVAGILGIDAMNEISHGAVFVDYDNDRDQDLYVTHWQGNSLYRNMLSETGTISFNDESLIAGLVDSGRAVTASWGDYDADGFLDLYLAKHKECFDFNNSQDSLYHNNGDGTFTNTTSSLCNGSNDCDAVNGLGFVGGWVDYDNDGDLDIYLANDDIDRIHYPNVLWRNDGEDKLNEWIFTDVSEEAGAGIDLNSMGLGIGDYNNDGWMDLACSNIGPNYLLQNQGDGTFNDVSASAGIEREMLPNGSSHSITWGTAFFDYDLDTHLDLFFVGGHIADPPDRADAFFINNTDGTFTEISDLVGLNSESRGRSASMADFDDDGYMDLFIGNWGEAPHLMRNTLGDEGNPGGWLKVTVSGSVSNRDAIGTRLSLTTPDGTTQMRDITSGSTHGGGDQRIAHFGMRNNDEGDLHVRWPTGETQTLSGLLPGMRLHLREGFSLTTLGETIAGEETFFYATGGTPNDLVALMSAISLGSTPVPNCPGVFLGITNAKLEGFDAADSDGNRLRPLLVPDIAAGQIGYFQSVDRATCTVSNITRVEFE